MACMVSGGSLELPALVPVLNVGGLENQQLCKVITMNDITTLAQWADCSVEAIYVSDTLVYEVRDWQGHLIGGQPFETLKEVAEELRMRARGCAVLL